MEELTERRKRRKTPWLLGGAVLLLFLLLTALQSSTLWRDLAIESTGDLVLLYGLSSLNFLAFIIFGFIFARSIIRLVVERRTLQLGSQIKTRLLLYFVAISVLPIIAMAVFSFLFMNRALERWFTQIPGDAIRETAELQKETVAQRGEMLDETAQMLAVTLERETVTAERLAGVASAGSLAYIAIETPNRPTVGGFGTSITENQHSEIWSLLLDRFGDSARDGFGFDVAMAEMSGSRRLVIVPERFSESGIAGGVEAPIAKFESLKEKELTIRQVGLLTLGVLTFLLIFASMWIAFYTARGLTNPIRALAEGAAEIGKGNLAHRVNVMAADELALLVAAFNKMSTTLEGNSEELSSRRRYIETVLETLPTGVLSVDRENQISTINSAAKSIFQLEDGDFSGIELSRIVAEENVTSLDRVVSRALRVGSASEHTTLKRDRVEGDSASEINVALTASAFPDGSGAVLVIEDLSELIAAQRASAWQEVARRMAHEIKNPLTPIQLSAERIAKRFAQSRQAAFAGIPPIDQNQDSMQLMVEESTATIVREVESLKAMVDEFSRFARLRDAKLELGNLGQIVTQAADVFSDRFDDITIRLDLSDAVPDTLLDSELLKSVFVNLIENAAEAFSEQDEKREIIISARHDSTRDLVIAEVVDNGKGIDPGDLQRLFQPYFSTKGRGTGLGLAIVRRIVTEHGGKIHAARNLPRGARFTVELPAT